MHNSSVGFLKEEERSSRGKAEGNTRLRYSAVAQNDASRNLVHDASSSFSSSRFSSSSPSSALDGFFKIDDEGCGVTIQQPLSLIPLLVKRQCQIEAINGAWAIIGLTTGLVIESQTGKGILAQVKLLSTLFVHIYTWCPYTSMQKQVRTHTLAGYVQGLGLGPKPIGKRQRLLEQQKEEVEDKAKAAEERNEELIARQDCIE
ncbi:hypothetical protein FNV43_RR02439 [Rhamnella rubrinervis]|uniref:Uncharacterized protein n=1 Tax=Rhamnella rubrinervis TaxID=2594499 RepID=A0A8K0HS81_9ROSA|nr:hypothetical protein FNV43_RR02439 [Rhamnella rubrinervis]